MLLQGCSIDPEPINFGSDICAYCKMKIADRTHGSVILSNKGKSFKFDSGECLFNYLKEGSISASDVKGYYIIDTSVPGKLIDAKKAFYLKSGNLKSPMGQGISAFEKKEDADKFLQQYGGTISSWDEISK
jgi:copper chaperone NosL